MPRMSRASSGFTLIEVLAIAPVILLVIGSLVVIIINLTGSSMRSQARVQLQNDVLAALDRMEQDVILSTAIDSTSPSQLKTTNFMTNKNPLDTTRQLIRRDCTVATGGVTMDKASTYTITYKTVGASVVRQTSVVNCAGSALVWQKSISETLISDATCTLTVGRPRSNVAEITLGAERKVSGQTLSFSGKMYAKSANIR